MSDAIVIGGGLAGAAVAIDLAVAGRPVRLFEREAGAHDKVCGGFLSFEAIDSLRRLGVDPAALGATSIARLTVHVGARETCAIPLPFPAMSLSRRVLDEALLQRAVATGVQVARGVRVTDLRRQGDGWAVQTTDGGAQTHEVFLATGKRDLKGWKRPAGLQPDLIGFQQHFRVSTEATSLLNGVVELYLFPGGYAGLEAVEGGTANLCLVIRRGAYAQLAGGWPTLVDYIRARCPGLDAWLDRTQPLSARPTAIAAIPYGFINHREDGLWRLGDQAAVIPSFAGEGMSIALHSAQCAAASFLAGRSPAEYRHALSRDLSRQVLGSTLLSQMMVRPVTQRVIASALAAAPNVARLVARHTRLRAA